MNLRRVAIFAGSILLGGWWLAAGTAPALAEGLAAPQAQDSGGQAIYEQRCAACHGAAGDGMGPATEHLFIKPRDFTRDEYKIKSTAGDEFPSHEDLTGVIAQGMPGTSMPAWEGILSEAEISEVADYIQTFGRFFSQDGYGTTMIDVPGRVSANEESIARGKQLFESDIGCLKCHGAEGRGNGPSAFEQTDSAGNVIFPADLTQPWRFRGGSEPEDIYLRLRTGMAGSPMPSFADALSEEDTWHLVNYVLSLSPETAPEPAVMLVSQYIDGALPEDPDNAAWTDVEPAYLLLAPQLMRAPRYFQPAVNAVMVRSLYNDDELAIYVTWDDRTETRSGDAVDAMAVQFPQELSEGDERPYFVFGDATNAVYQWYWSAGTDTVAERNARGLPAVADQPAEQQHASAMARYDDGRWQLLFRRPLHTEDENDLQFETNRFIPIAFMVWEGYAGETAERFGLTTWSSIFLQPPTPAIQYAQVPAAMIIIAVLELGVVWWVRRGARNRKGV
jgi:cbb3-type cytochrome c oxidase subunit III